ncbi:uncharacterized protein LOC144129430 isoform X1 [Amblyomma americanum]
MAAFGLIEMEGSEIWTSGASEEHILVSDACNGRASLASASTNPFWNNSQNIANLPGVSSRPGTGAGSTVNTGRRNSLTSRYYCNPSECQKECCNGASEAVGHTSTFSVKQSPQLPTWLWLLVARCLRVPLPGRKACLFFPSVGLLLQVLTVLSCVGLCVVHIVYEIRLITVSHGESKTLYRCVSIFLVVSWGLFGLYARRLARRLFSHPAFIKDIRMHSKTLLKINAAALAIMLGAMFLAVNAYSARAMIQGETCALIGFPRIVCLMHFILRVVYSFFSLMWNGLVCMVLVSVARTHTIGLRRFIRELEADAVNYETRNAKKYSISPLTAEDICDESVWIENNTSPSGSYIPDDCYSQVSSHRHVRVRNCASHNISVVSGAHDSDITGSSADLSVGTSPPERSLSIAEILHVYWKVSCRLRLTGRALQRWVGSLIGLVVFWCSSQLVTWLNHSPTAWEVVQFVCPLTLLLVVTSSVAEVNLEGSRVLKCIRPTEERIQMMNFLLKAPIQLSTFGFSLSYGTIMTVVLGVLMAFASKLIIVEIQANTG